MEKTRTVIQQIVKKEDNAMKVTAIYQLADANPFLESECNYKRVTGRIPEGYTREMVEKCAREATPQGYVFVGLERAE